MPSSTVTLQLAMVETLHTLALSGRQLHALLCSDDMVSRIADLVLAIVVRVRVAIRAKGAITANANAAEAVETETRAAAVRLE